MIRLAGLNYIGIAGRNLRPILPWCRRIMAVLLFVPQMSSATDYYIDPVLGNDAGAGTVAQPWKTVATVIEHLPEVVTDHVRVYLAPGVYTTTGGRVIPASTLVLDRRMRRASDFLIDVSVYFIGTGTNFHGLAEPGAVLLNWGSTPLVHVLGGTWHFENVQIGNRTYPTTQQAVEAYGTDSLVFLKDVRIHTGSQSGAGIVAGRGAEVRLAGAIELNEDLHETELANSFCGIVAMYQGAVRCVDSGGTLSLGNGSLSAGYYGTVELGCATARITSWNRQANCLAVNNSGRIDLHGTGTTLVAKHVDNTLIGLEDDGHILAEGARIILQTGSLAPGKIVLQKTSTLYGGPMVIQGPRGVLFAIMSGSVLVGSAVGAIESVGADTGGYCYLTCSQAPAATNQVRNGRIDLTINPVLSATPGAITFMSVDAEGRVSLAWTPNALGYIVQYATNLVDGDWSAAEGVWPTLEPAWSSTAPATDRARYYRVQGR